MCLFFFLLPDENSEGLPSSRSSKRRSVVLVSNTGPQKKKQHIPEKAFGISKALPTGKRAQTVNLDGPRKGGAHVAKTKPPKSEPSSAGDDVLSLSKTSELFLATPKSPEAQLPPMNTDFLTYDPEGPTTWAPHPEKIAKDLMVESVDKKNTWYNGKIIEGPKVRKGKDQVKIHFTGWNKRNDLWVDANSNRIRAHGTCDKMMAEARAKHAALLEQLALNPDGAPDGADLQAQHSVVSSPETASQAKAKARKASSGSSVDTDNGQAAKKAKIKQEPAAADSQVAADSSNAVKSPGVNLTEMGRKLWQVLDAASKAEWHAVFDKLPTRRELPSYYQIIKEPFDLQMMRARVKKNEYRTVRSFTKDVKLIVKNAQQFNLDNSDIYKVAATLSNEFTKFLSDVGLKIEPLPKRKRSTSSTKLEDVWNVVLTPEEKEEAKTEADKLQAILFDLAKSGEIKPGATLRCGPIKATLQPDGYFIVGDILERFPTVIIQNWIMKEEGGDEESLWSPITVDNANLRKLRQTQEINTKRREKQDEKNKKRSAASIKITKQAEKDDEGSMGCPVPARGLEPVLLGDASGELISKRIGAHVTSFDNYIEWNDICFACGSSPGIDTSEDCALLTCKRCAEPYHRFCVDSLEKGDDGSNWLCYSCKNCAVCKSGWPQEGMLTCDNCNKLTHYSCLKFPPPKNTIENRWLCSDCVKCKSCHRTTPGDLPTSHWMYVQCQINNSAPFDKMTQHLDLRCILLPAP